VPTGRQAAPSGPLARGFDAEYAAPMALELADLTREAMPGHTMQLLPTDIAVGGTRVRAGKPAVLSLQVLYSLHHSL